MAAEASRVLDNLKARIPGGVSAPLERMSDGQRQVVAIARGAHWCAAC